MGRICSRAGYRRLRWLVCCGAVFGGWHAVLAEPFDGYHEAMRINAEVNASHVYTPRIARWYRPWRIIGRGEPGNCLDYAVLKCAELRKAGFNSERLDLLAFTRWNGEGHALCVIDGKWGMDWKDRPVLATHEALQSSSPFVPVRVTVDWRSPAN